MNELATVAIVVPCNNVAHIVDQCINSLIRQEYPQDKFSIIAVNDGSTDNTKDHLEVFKTHPNFYRTIFAAASHLYIINRFNTCYCTIVTFIFF